MRGAGRGEQQGEKKPRKREKGRKKGGAKGGVPPLAGVQGQHPCRWPADRTAGP